MQINSCDNLQEMTKPVFWEKSKPIFVNNKKHIVNLSSTEFAQRVVRVNECGLYLHNTIFAIPHILRLAEYLWPSQPNRVMSSVVSLPNHTFTGQA